MRLSEYVRQLIRSRGEAIEAKTDKVPGGWVGQVVLVKGEDESEVLVTTRMQRKEHAALTLAAEVIAKVRGT